MAILPKLSYSFNTFLPQTLASCFAEIDKLTLQFTWICKGARGVKTNVERKNKGGGLPLPTPKLTLKQQ